MSQNEHFLQLLAEQIKEFDSLQEAIDSASEDEDVQFFLSYVATNEPELLDQYKLWDFLVNKDSWQERFHLSSNVSTDGSLQVGIGFSD